MQKRGSQFHDPVHHGQPEQLQMFMTANEIMAKYQPLDADRYGAGTMGRSGHPSSGTPIETAMNASGGNVRHGQFRVGVDTGGTYQASTYGTKYRAHGESHEEMMERKLDESMYEQMVPGKATEYATPEFHRHTGATGTEDLSETAQGEKRWARGGSYWTEGTPQVKRPGTPSMSLYDSIQMEGIEKPLSLGTAGGHGSAGKREIVGGHHRLAAQADIDPNQPIPVVHYHDIWDARHDPTRKYT